VCQTNCRTRRSCRFGTAVWAHGSDLPTKEALKAILQRLVALWLARTIAMFVIKMVLKVISLLFGFPGGYFDASWMETQALIRI
jgi:hypothetical protein